jgi:hypothetical protein
MNGMLREPSPGLGRASRAAPNPLGSRPGLALGSPLSVIGYLPRKLSGLAIPGPGHLVAPLPHALCHPGRPPVISHLPSPNL